MYHHLYRCNLLQYVIYVLTQRYFWKLKWPDRKRKFGYIIIILYFIIVSVATLTFKGGGWGLWVLRLIISQNYDNKPWAYIRSKGFSAGLIFRGAYFRRDLLLDGILHSKMGWPFLKQ